MSVPGFSGLIEQLHAARRDGLAIEQEPEPALDVDSMIAYVLPTEGALKMREILWNLDRMKHVGELTSMMRSWSDRSSTAA